MSPVMCVSVPHIFPHKVCNRSTAYNAGVQGLHANVAVLDAELMGIDREQQSISLSNGQKVLYGMLVIAAGLDQASSIDITGQVEGPFTNVISLKSAVKLSTEVDILLQLLTSICRYMTDCLPECWCKCCSCHLHECMFHGAGQDIILQFYIAQILQVREPQTEKTAFSKSQVQHWLPLAAPYLQCRSGATAPH